MADRRLLEVRAEDGTIVRFRVTEYGKLLVEMDDNSSKKAALIHWSRTREVAEFFAANVADRER